MSCMQGLLYNERTKELVGFAKASPFSIITQANHDLADAGCREGGDDLNSPFSDIEGRRRLVASLADHLEVHMFVSIDNRLRVPCNIRPVSAKAMGAPQEVYHEQLDLEADLALVGVYAQSYVSDNHQGNTVRTPRWFSPPQKCSFNHMPPQYVHTAGTATAAHH